MVPTSDVSICNLALSHLGESPIVTLEDANERAKALNVIYASTRDAILRAKDWKFAKVKEALAEISGQVIPGWTYVYGYPSRCLCARRVFVDTESQDPAPIEYDTMFIPALARKVIVTNYPVAYIAYTYAIENPQLFDSSFVQAMSFSLASQVAKPLTTDDNLTKLMLQIYGSFVSDAAKFNYGESYKKATESSSIEDSRG